MRCSASRFVATHAVRSKEATPELVRQVAADLGGMGHNLVVLKSDNEFTSKALSRRVSCDTIPP